MATHVTGAGGRHRAGNRSRADRAGGRGRDRGRPRGAAAGVPRHDRPADGCRRPVVRPGPPRGATGNGNRPRPGRAAVARRRPRRLPRPSLSGLAALQGRQGRRNLPRHPDRAEMVDRADLRGGLAQHRLPDQIFLALGLDRQPADAAAALLLGTRRPDGRADGYPRAAALVYASRKYCEAALRPRGQDRTEGLNGDGRFRSRRPATPRLAPPDP